MADCNLKLTITVKHVWLVILVNFLRVKVFSMKAWIPASWIKVGNNAVCQKKHPVLLTASALIIAAFVAFIAYGLSTDCSDTATYICCDP